MTNSYDKHYQQENLFGAPYPELIEFFARQPTKGRVLDMGCGQGRNAIPITKLGYDVVGIDLSEIGIKQMLEASQEQGLHIEGKLVDLYDFDQFNDFDFILFDSMFHFAKKDREREMNLIRRVFDHAKQDAQIIFCIPDMGRKVLTLKELVANTPDLTIRQNTSLTYLWIDSESGHRSSTKYKFIAVGKGSG